MHYIEKSNLRKKKEILPNISNCRLQIKIQIYSLSYTNKYIKIKIKMPQ